MRILSAAADLQLRRRCAAALREIDIPHPWDFDEFLRRDGERRGRRVVVAAAPALAGKCTGQWWKLADGDLILHAPTNSTFERDLIVFHEVAHIACDHDDDAAGSLIGRDVEEMALAAGLAGYAGAVQTMLARDVHLGRLVEREAEYTAYRLKLLAERAGHRITADDPAAHMLSAMRRTLGSAD